MKPDDNKRSFIPISKGSLISRYRIIEKIGAGGMGEAYLAEGTELDRRVALKFPPPHLCQDEECRKRFRSPEQFAPGNQSIESTDKMPGPNLFVSEKQFKKPICLRS